MAEFIKIYGKLINHKAFPLSDFKVVILTDDKPTATTYSLADGSFLFRLDPNFREISFEIYRNETFDEDKLIAREGPFSPEMFMDEARIPEIPVDAPPFDKTGPQGPKGDQGARGLQGIKGDKGDPGTNGSDGSKGDKGDQGIQGIQGETGARGLQGLKGDKGDPGTDGSDGAKGDKGDQGIQGPKFSDQNTSARLSNGWYRFATGGGNRHSNEFYLREQTSSHHHTLHFSASIHYSRNPIITVLSNSFYYNDGCFGKLRIVSKSTYDPVYLEVYIDSAFDRADNCLATKLSETGNDWRLIDFESGSIPEGYTTTEINIADARGINTTAEINADNGIKVKGNLVIDKDGNWKGNTAGLEGQKGDKGDPGTNGSDGTDGISVSSANINNQGELILTLSDNSTTSAGIVKGQDGKGIESVDITLDGDLNIRYTDGQTDTIINLNSLSMSKPKEYKVQGYIINLDGTPYKGATVKVYDKQLGKLTELGSTTTGPTGKYLSKYTQNDIDDLNKETPDLVVKVYNGANLLTESPLIMNAEVEEDINLVIGDGDFAGMIEYELIKSALESRGVTPENVESFLSTDTAVEIAKTFEIGTDQVSAYLQALKFVKETSLDYPYFFYALIKLGKLDSLSVILRTPTSKIKGILEEAVNEQLIHSNTKDEIDSFISKIYDASPSLAIDKNEGDNSELDKIFNSSSLDGEQKAALVKNFIEYEGEQESFWQRLKEDRAFTSEKVDDIQNTSEVTAITGNLDFTNHLKSNAGLRSAKELTRLNVEDLKTQVKESRIDIPPFVAGEKEEDKQENFARIIKDRIEDAFPTTSFAARLEQDRDTESKNFDSFFSANSTFDFDAQPVDTYLEDNKEALNFLSSDDEKEAFKSDLQGMQRLFKLAPKNEKFESVKPLWNDKLKSATAIQKMGEASFTAKYKSVLGEEKVKHIFNASSQNAAMALSVMANFSADFNALTPAVISNISFQNTDSVDGIPDLETLFGSLDMCSCKHCRSVYSPAAYLVDLLSWINEVEQSDGSTLKDTLFDRRKEIENILLTCENTNTPLPYVDLVIEVLENAMQASDSPSFNRQTTLGADFLKAHPENMRSSVYSELKKEVYPWSAPFHLHEAEAHIYLNHLGLSYADLLKHTPSTATPIEVASKILKLSPLERAIITGNASNVNSLTGTSINFTHYYGGASVAQLQNVKTLLEKSGLIYDELVELIESRYINPAQVNIGFSTASCDLDNATLGFSQTEFEKLHRFYRLKEKLGWSVEELDLALKNSPALDDNYLINLASLVTIQEKLDVPVKEVTAWFANLDTTSYFGENSFYKEVFVNPSVNKPDEIIPGYGTIENIFSLNGTSTELVNNSTNIHTANIKQLILAGSVMNEEELEIIFPSNASPVNTTNIANLSYIYRVSTFTKALGISVEEYDILTSLSGITPIKKTTGFALPSDLLNFLDVIEELNTLGVSVEELNYVLNDESVDNSKVPFDSTLYAKALTDLRKELATTKEDFKITNDSFREKAIQQLSLFINYDFTSGAWTQKTIDQLVSIIDGTTELNETEAKTYLTDNLTSLLGSTQVNVIKTKVYGPSGMIPEDQLETRYQDCFPGLDALIESLLWPSTRKKIIIEQLSSFYSIDADVLKELIDVQLDQIGNSSQHIELFTNDTTFVSTTTAITAANFPAIFSNGKLLHKVALITKKLGLKAAELAYAFLPTSFTSLLDLQSLSSAISTSAFSNWRKSAQLAGINKVYKGEISVISILHEAFLGNLTASETLSKLNTLTRWKDLDYIVGTSFYSFATSDTNYYKKPNWIFDIQDTLNLVKRSEIKAETLLSWAKDGSSARTDMDYATTVSIINSGKSKHGAKKWLSIAPDLRDKLRIQQRDALAQYMIINPPTGVQFEDTNSLYEYYLIDPEMDPCRLTSRIKQANSTIQLFVQRIMMNLEIDKTMTNQHVKEWEWRKNYRVWEANRKVFLYPENWIEPELRDDKTNFFKDLEDDLQQQDINMDNATSYYLKYLEKLDDVADLEICQLYKDEEENVVYVFARTKSTPHVYHYRKWVDDAYWTHWEKVEVDIEGDHLIPVVFNNRLMIFWANFIEKAVMPTKTEINATVNGDNVNAKLPSKYLEMYLNWSEFKDKKWAKRRRSKNFVKVEDTDSAKAHMFSYIDDLNELHILVGERLSYHYELVSRVFQIYRLWKRASSSIQVQISQGGTTTTKTFQTLGVTMSL